MAIEIKFSCNRRPLDFLKIDSVTKEVIIEGYYNGIPFSFYLDETTAIKFAKTVRTKINLIKEDSNV